MIFKEFWGETARVLIHFFYTNQQDISLQEIMILYKLRIYNKCSIKGLSIDLGKK